MAPLNLVLSHSTGCRGFQAPELLVAPLNLVLSHSTPAILSRKRDCSSASVGELPNSHFFWKKPGQRRQLQLDNAGRLP